MNKLTKPGNNDISQKIMKYLSSPKEASGNAEVAFLGASAIQVYPLLFRGIWHKMVSAERSAAFDRRGGICYNKGTKGNTADRRSAPIKLLTKK